MRYLPLFAVLVTRHESARSSSAWTAWVMSRDCRSVNVEPSVTAYWSVLTFVLSIVGK